jgi:hypothetical protein
MAKRPRRYPDWATTPYGPGPLAWDEAVKTCRAALYIWAITGPHCSELIPLATAIPWLEGAYKNPARKTWMGSPAELDVEEDLPVILALVYRVEEGMPFAGFWSPLPNWAFRLARRQIGGLSFGLPRWSAARGCAALGAPATPRRARQQNAPKRLRYATEPEPPPIPACRRTREEQDGA